MGSKVAYSVLSLTLSPGVFCKSRSACLRHWVRSCFPADVLASYPGLSLDEHLGAFCVVLRPWNARPNMLQRWLHHCGEQTSLLPTCCVSGQVSEVCNQHSRASFLFFFNNQTSYKLAGGAINTRAVTPLRSVLRRDHSYETLPIWVEEVYGTLTLRLDSGDNPWWEWTVRRSSQGDAYSSYCALQSSDQKIQCEAAPVHKPFLRAGILWRSSANTKRSAEDARGCKLMPLGPPTSSWYSLAFSCSRGDLTSRFSKHA